MDDLDAAGRSEVRRGGRRVKAAVLAPLLIAAAVGFGWLTYTQRTGRFLQRTNDAEIRADTVAVAPRAAGYLAEVFVTEDQDVAAGQPLARIDAKDARAQAERARAGIALATAAMDNARAGADEQRAAVDEARARLSAAQAKAAFDVDEVARYAPLAAVDAEPREKLAELRQAAAQSAADARAMQASLAMQQRRIASVKAQLRQGAAQAQDAQAQLSAASVDVDAALIRSPVAGRVGDKSATVGQYAQAGARLMSVVPLQSLYVVANFKETQLELMRPGQPARIRIDALGGLEVGGRVASVSPATGAQFSLLPPQNATGNFTKIVQRVPVRIDIEAGPHVRRLLVPGLSVTATVDTASAQGERAALRREQHALDAQGPRR